MNLEDIYIYKELKKKFISIQLYDTIDIFTI